MGFAAAKNCLIPRLASCLGIVILTSPLAIADEADILFENQIRPVLATVCFGCHGDTKEAGGLRVDSRDALLTGGDSGPAMVPGAPDASLLLKAIGRHDDVSAMPPDSDKALRPEQLVAFEKWIRDGAYWPASQPRFESLHHWAFEPLQVHDLPRSNSNTNPIDTFLHIQQEAAGVQRSSRADKVTLIRRSTFDLTGLPPTQEEIQSFLRDTSSEAFATVIDRLLASQEYGRRWGRHWLDVVRYADTAGETADYPVPLAWKYRNYVIDAFNADKPYDQFIREQIAGDVLADLSPDNRYAEQVTATGYLAISRRFGFDSENYHHLTIQDTIDNLGQSVLGLSLGCARCHDHKFDPISIQDYYGLYAIFDSTRYAFPGSEQKQKTRSMVPLVPPKESISKWRDYDQKVAILATISQSGKQAVPTANLRSLHDMDGDFEMQAPAAGGSNGVLVPPWLYEGKISVTTAAQSPFKNLYAQGKVGASIPAEGGPYRIAQSVYPQRNANNCVSLYVNLDFRIVADAKAKGLHQIWIGSLHQRPMLQIWIGTDSVSLQANGTTKQLGQLMPNQWHNLQLQCNLVEGNVLASLTSADQLALAGHLPPIVLKDLALPKSTIAIDCIVLESMSSEPTPAIEFDNLGLQEVPIPPASLIAVSGATQNETGDVSDLERQLQALIGMGGDFEFQSEGQPLEFPWNGGPNSVVQVASRAQSSLTPIFPIGKLGVHMPNRSQYDGFGLTLPKIWTLQNSEKLFATLDFRIADITSGGEGSWRFYVGHGPGNSAAVELFFNGNQIFQRSGDARLPIQSIPQNQWIQVQLELDLKTKCYTGTLRTELESLPFQGEFATGWDGTIDYSFIDSYGHLGGVRPAIDVDNYEICDVAFDQQKDSPEPLQSDETSAGQAKAFALKNKIKEVKLRSLQAVQELNQLLVDGPFEMAYGVTEGTPHSVRMHLRGDPNDLGEQVPRGWLQVLGQRTLSDDSPGSGRLELAGWLTEENNPLTARVMVNRIWQYHFGFGLVKTPNDFGLRGLPPTHPGLLDFLAVEFIRNGWSVKSMHRLMMLSETYQQSSSKGSSSHTDRDRYTYFSRRRLSAEEIRDSILMVSGELDRESGEEHPFPSPLGWGYSQHGPFNEVYDHNKRSVYLMVPRLKRHPYLGLFDGPDPNASTADRLGTTVPTQALYFLNDPFIYAKSEAWARRILSHQQTIEQYIDEAFVSAFARPPSQREQVHAYEFIEAYRTELQKISPSEVDVLSMAAFLRTLFASNEFLYLD